MFVECTSRFRQSVDSNLNLHLIFMRHRCVIHDSCFFKSHLNYSPDQLQKESSRGGKKGREIGRKGISSSYKKVRYLDIYSEQHEDGHSDDDLPNDDERI